LGFTSGSRTKVPKDPSITIVDALMEPFKDPLVFMGTVVILFFVGATAVHSLYLRFSADSVV